MKGIILAGGSGTRMYPLTVATSKQLLPVYDKPMIYYPLSVLMLANIKDILIITTPHDLSRYELLFGNGSKFGMNFEYSVQEKPRGLADAFIVGKDFIGDDDVTLILGDNIFYGNQMSVLLSKAIDGNEGATLFAYQVRNPSDFGVVEFDADMNALSIEEKPENPKSNYAVTGLYVFDNSVINIAKNIKPSERGELEITSVNNEYLNNKNLKVITLTRGFAWLDTGSHTNLIRASQFMETLERNQSLKVACVEEIAWEKGWITDEMLLRISSEYKNDYGKYLRRLIE